MSLNFFEKKGTIAESKQNFKRAKVDVQTAAIELDTSDENIKNILVLNNVRPEDPWILKEYIHEKTKQNGGEKFPYSKLTGDFHNYWFLNHDLIEAKKINL